MAGEFQREAGRWRKFEDMCGILDASLAHISQLVSINEQLSAEDRIQRLETLKESALDIASVGAEAKGRSAACGEMARQMNMEMHSGEAISDFLGLYDSGVVSAQQHGRRSSHTRAPEVVRVQKLIDRLAHGGDEDLEIEEAVGSAPRTLRCPVLNQDIEKPVKSTVCGHVYSMAGVISALYQAQRIMNERMFPKTLDRVPAEYETRCPVVGCQHKISARNLKRDFGTELTQRQLLSAKASVDDSDAVDVL